MKHFAGLEVSAKEISICIIDKAGAERLSGNQFHSSSRSTLCHRWRHLGGSCPAASQIVAADVPMLKTFRSELMAGPIRNMP